MNTQRLHKVTKQSDETNWWNQGMKLEVTQSDGNIIKIIKWWNKKERDDIRMTQNDDTKWQHKYMTQMITQNNDTMWWKILITLHNYTKYWKMMSKWHKAMIHSDDTKWCKKKWLQTLMPQIIDTK